MFTICVLSVFFTLAVSNPIPNLEDANAQILTYDYKALDDGYSFEYTTSNGITRQETGHLKVVTNPDTREPDEIMDVEGFYSYTGDDGKLYQVTYHADENGFVPQVSTSASNNVVSIGGRKPFVPAQKQARPQYTFPYKRTDTPKDKYGKLKY
ncbi:hypothetical protein HHI36_006373 [Cryptolaemus montrouzieri]|uniref:Uncharacterized protein n=1 Tax=Cryptolaemus montrouzieri TaxID=559131 RepID=A0ABD2NX70_9CUCU